MGIEKLARNHAKKLKEHWDVAETMVPAIRIDGDDFRAIYLACCYGRTRNLSVEIRRCHASDAYEGGALLARALIEVYADILNLCSDQHYHRRREASHILSWLKMLKEARDSDNPFLSSFRELPDLAEQITELERQFETLRLDGHHPISPTKRLLQANLEAVLGSVYNDLSTYVHNDLRELISAYVTLNQDGQREVSFHPNSERRLHWLSMLDLAFHVSAVSTRKIHEYFETDKVQQARDLDAEHSAYLKEMKTSLRHIQKSGR